MGKPTKLKLRWKDASSFIEAALSQERVSGLTHDFYRYPARFSPIFCRSSVESLTDPGDLVVDPFCGGGTTLVETRSSGRLGLGSDISALAHFVATVKTRVYKKSDFLFFDQWFARLSDGLNLRAEVKRGKEWIEMGYFRNLNCPQTRPIRKLIQLALQRASYIRENNRKDFVKCVILRTAQWALDGRKEIPSATEFRMQLLKISRRMIDGAREFSKLARINDAKYSVGGRTRAVCLHDKATGIAKYIDRRKFDSPKLILTSPPYPGVHIVYHRWQVKGGKETPAPFWIADKLDGSGESYYLMNARDANLDRYYDGIYQTYSSLRPVVNREALIVQMLAFSKPEEQLPRYLKTMEKSGYSEVVLSEQIDSQDGRIWREVPSRKWHANNKGKLASGKEVVLIHRPK